MKSITIIGGGNLGRAIAEGLIVKKYCKASEITITRRNLGPLEDLKKKGVKISSDNVRSISHANIILLCVKPFQAKEVLREITSSVKKSQIIVSMVSGVGAEEISSLLKSKISVFRAMPNTAVAIGESMTCISAYKAQEEELARVKELFEQVGKAIIIDEKLMDAATILGACGTGFAMRYIRACMQGGIEIGFDAKTARLIAAQTVKGAADLLLKHNTHPEEEIDKVTTPKGVTITGLNQMEHNGLSSSVIKGITESYKKMNT
jgi:pyrroline-5-carboxylate reductase